MRMPILLAIIVIMTTLLSVWQQQLVLCKSLGGSSSPARQLLKHSAMALLKNHHLIDQATARGVTSSQVIEYNARNIVLMTLLNSVLILGGLFGTLNQHPDLAGAVGFHAPFKRIDLSSIKKRFGKKRTHRPNYPHHHRVPLIDPMVMIEELENAKPIGIKRPAHPASNELIPDADSIGASAIDYEIYPRQMMNVRQKTNIQQRLGDRRNDPDPTDKPTTLENCALVIRCKDSANGKFYYPSLSSLTKIAVQLLNEETEQTNRKSKALMLEQVKRMIEIEQNSKDSCHWKQLCQFDS